MSDYGIVSILILLDVILEVMRSVLRVFRFPVSILILLDVILEGGEVAALRRGTVVSILILLDVILEEEIADTDVTSRISFNPYFAGCNSGRRTNFYSHVFQYNTN